MAQATLRPILGGPAFTRLLARLADADVAPPVQPLPEQLGQWLDWTQALALAAALDGPATAPTADAAPRDALATECAQARQTLAAAIRDAPLLALGAATPTAPDFAAFRQLCLARQRAAQAASGRLRGKLRDALAQTSPELARLAAVDAALEQALSPRESALLARLPALLEARYERLRAAGGHAPTALDGFRRDMQAVLLAELELRFQPLDALLAAPRTDD